MNHVCTDKCPLYPLPPNWTHHPRKGGHHIFKLKGHPGAFASISAAKKYLFSLAFSFLNTYITTVHSNKLLK